MNITYYLGAGASYYSVPIVGELDKAFGRIENLASQNEAELIKRGVKSQFEKLMNQMQSASKASKIFGTIDTFAKHLWLTNTNEFHELKKALSLFFTIWQETEKSYFNANVIRDIDFEEIDHRYLGLLANFLEKSNNGEVILSKGVKFISWNYDNQLEKALSIFSGANDLISTFDRFKIHPFNYRRQNEPTVLHLNGMAGIFEKANEHFTSFLSEKSFQSKLFIDVVQRVLDEAGTSELNNNKYFTFAWENDEISIEGLKQAHKMLEDTEVLVIIGYSFPTFNDQIDKKLFSILGKSRKLQAIYYQDPNASVEILKARFGISEDKVRVINNTNQFVLPLESTHFKNNEYYYNIY